MPRRNKRKNDTRFTDKQKKTAKDINLDFGVFSKNAVHRKRRKGKGKRA